MSDNGIGIPAGDRERIFEMLERLHTQREYAGSGMGLAICRRIVEGHGGRIWAEPNWGRERASASPSPIQRTGASMASAGNAAQDADSASSRARIVSASAFAADSGRTITVNSLTSPSSPKRR